MKIKSARILGVVMTLMLVASLVVGIPLSASAGTQAWSAVAVPGATGLVIADADIGPIEVASDGTIYASAYSESAGALFATNTINTYSVLKSTDQGHSFSVTGLVNLATPIVAIVASPLAAGTVFVTTAAKLYKSTNAGTAFTQQYDIPAVFGDVLALDVTAVGSAHKVMIGTGAGGVNSVATAMDSDLGTWTSIGDAGFGDVLAVAFSRTFSTDSQVIAVAEVGAVVKVTSRFGSGAWGATLGDVTLPIITAAGTDTAVIELPSDYSSAAGSSFFYVGVTDDTSAATLDKSGVYYIAAAAATTATLRLADNLQSLAVSGAAASATLFVGSADANHVHRSTNAGASWLLASKAPTGTMNTYVAVASDFATSNIVYAAVSGAEGAFSVSVEGGVYFNQYALIDTALNSIDQLALAGSNTLFMVTSGDATTVTTPAINEPIKAVVTTAFANGAGNATYDVTYIDQDGVAGNIGALTIPVNATAGTSIPIVLAGGDTGAQDVTLVAATSTGNHAAGVFNLVGVTTGNVFGTVTHSAVFTPTFTDGALPSEPLAVSVTTAFSSGNVYAFGYINQAGAAAAGTVTIIGAFAGIVALAGGDTGVRDVTSSSLVLDMASVSGVFDLVGTLTGTIYSTTNLVGILTDGAMIADAAQAVVVTTAFAGGSSSATFTVSYTTGSGAAATVALSIPVNSALATIVALGVSVNDITGISMTNSGGHTAGAFQIEGVTTFATVGALATESIAGVYSAPYVDSTTYDGTPAISVTTYPNSVWRTASALTGGGWARIALETPTADIPTLVGASNAYATDNTAFLATGKVVQKSTTANAAALFTGVPHTDPDLANDASAIKVVDPSTVYIGTAGGTVERTTNAGLDWPAVAVGAAVTSVAVSGSNVLAGNSAGGVWLSADSGATFRALGATGALAGATFAAFDPGFATNNLVYATSAGATVIDRVTVVGAGTDVAATIAAAGVGVGSGIAAFAGPTGLPATLYVADSTADTAPARSINPNATAPAFEPTGLNAAGAALPGTTATLAGLVGMVTASNTLWAIDTTGIGVLTFTDTLNIQPAAGASVATSPTSAAISWPAVTNAATYAVTVTTTFPDPAVPVATLNPDGSPNGVVTGMTTGAAYTFTVNVATPDLSYASAAAPLTTQPGPPPWNPSLPSIGAAVSVSPAPGATGVPTTPTLQWNTTTGATGFELLVSTSSATTGDRLTTGDVVDKTLAGNGATVYTITPALSNNTTYFWQVRAALGSNFSPWSAVFAFTTAPAPAPVVTPPTPITTVTTITIPPPVAQPTPAWVWAIIAIGGVLLVVVIVLIARTRKI